MAPPNTWLELPTNELPVMVVGVSCRRARRRCPQPGCRKRSCSGIDNDPATMFGNPWLVDP